MLSDEHTETFVHNNDICEQPINAYTTGIGLDYSYTTSQLTGSKKVIKVHVCPTCQKEFTQASNLQRHQKVHTGERDFVCNFCSKTFNRKDSLKKHLWNIHKTI